MKLLTQQDLAARQGAAGEMDARIRLNRLYLSSR